MLFRRVVGGMLGAAGRRVIGGVFGGAGAIAIAQPAAPSFAAKNGKHDAQIKEELMPHSLAHPRPDTLSPGCAVCCKWCNKIHRFNSTNFKWHILTCCVASGSVNGGPRSACALYWAGVLENLGAPSEQHRKSLLKVLNARNNDLAPPASASTSTPTRAIGSAAGTAASVGQFNFVAFSRDKIEAIKCAQADLIFNNALPLATCNTPEFKKLLTLVGGETFATQCKLTARAAGGKYLDAALSTVDDEVADHFKNNVVKSTLVFDGWTDNKGQSRCVTGV
jgi:hypothetical protein